jgi:hypothetical protein
MVLVLMILVLMVFVIPFPLCPALNRVLRDACRDAGGRATQETEAERVRERGSNKSQLLWLISLHPGLLSQGEEFLLIIIY